MANVIFSGESKQMIVTSGGSQLNVERDLYSGWKVWSRTGTNTKFLQAFRTFGGDPTATGQYAPKYFFLLNGWKVSIDGNDLPYVEVALNLYVDGGGNPFVLSNDATVSNRLSDVAIVETSTAPAALTLEEHNQLMGLENMDPDAVITGVTTAPTMTQMMSGVTEMLGLSQSNFSMTNQTYNPSGSLMTCIIKTYPTASDMTMDANTIATYDVTATYDGSGLLNDYKVAKR